MLIKCWYVFSPNGRSNHGRCSVMKVVLKISQNTQESTCAGVTFLIKLQTGTGVFLWLLRNFYEWLFYRTPLENCFCTEENAYSSIFTKMNWFFINKRITCIHKFSIKNIFDFRDVLMLIKDSCVVYIQLCISIWQSLWRINYILQK